MVVGGVDDSVVVVVVLIAVTDADDSVVVLVVVVGALVFLLLSLVDVCEDADNGKGDDPTVVVLFLVVVEVAINKLRNLV